MDQHETAPDLTKLYDAVRATERLEYKAIDLCNEAVKLLARIMEVTRELKATIDAVIDLKISERSTTSDDNASTADDDNANKDFYDHNKDSQQMAGYL